MLNCKHVTVVYEYNRSVTQSSPKLFADLIMPANFRLSALTIAISSICLPGAVAFAQTAPLSTEKSADDKKSADPKSDPNKARQARAEDGKEKIQQVLIQGGQSDDDVRRQSTAAKLVFGREELDRNGDTNLGEVLKRLPGVTVGGRPGRGGDIRMRGMGNGYTQILVNGERPPRGFSMDTLTPDQVERIEIIRGAVAEYSTQAIAGTINIVLREDYKQKNTDLKISLGSEQGRLAPNVSLTYPIDLGNLNVVLSGSVFQNKQLDQSWLNTQAYDANGNTTLLQNEVDTTHRQSTGLHLTPRFSYRFENGDTLTFQPFIMTARSNSDGSSQVNTVYRAPDLSEPPAYAMAANNGFAENTMLRGFGNWQHKMDNGAKLQVRFGGGFGKMDNSSFSNEFDANGNQVAFVSVVNSTRDKSLTNGGKYTMPLGEGHTLAAGWDLEYGKRDQTSVSLSNGRPQFDDSGDTLTASTKRIAFFAQDEFDISPELAAYAGLRWEAIRTTSTSDEGAVDNTSRVLSPILQGVWRIPGESKNQIRLGYASTYRAPSLNDLIAIPSISNLNSFTRPDRYGNPNLKPELSKGLDLAFEHYMSRAGVVSANLFVRRISDLMRRQTSQIITSNGLRWVSAPTNIGDATTKGVELEAKFQLQEFFPQGPAIDLRSNYSRFWSNVDGISGSNNRIDSQPAQTANFGLDYRLAGLPLTVGGNLNWTPAYYTQSSNQQLNYTGIKRQLDVYTLWKVNPNLQLRLSANNLTAADYLSASEIGIDGANRISTTNARTYTSLNLRIEMKL